MGRTSFLLSLGCLLTLGFPAQKRPVKFGRIIGAGGAVVTSGDTAAHVAVFLTAGDFFEGIERTETGGVPEFRKGGRRVDRYPPETLVVVLVSVLKRGPVPAPRPRFDPEFGRDFANSLDIDLQWKQNLAMRPAEALHRDFRDRSSVEGLSFVAGLPGKFPQLNEWAWEFQVVSKDVPLTDHLVITIYGKDGKRLTRLSGGP